MVKAAVHRQNVFFLFREASALLFKTPHELSPLRSFLLQANSELSCDVNSQLPSDEVGQTLSGRLMLENIHLAFALCYNSETTGRGAPVFIPEV